MRHFAAVFLLLVLTARYGFAEHPNGWSIGIVPIGSSFWIADFFETYVEIKPSFGIGIDFEGKSDNYTLNNGIYHEGGTGLKFGLLAAAGFRFWTESRRNVPVAKTRDTGAAFVQPSDISWGFGGALNILFASRKGKEGISDLHESVIGGAGFVFLDFTYLEIDIDILSSNSKTNVKNDKGTDMLHFGLSAMLRFPFNLTYVVAMFPLLGVDYQIFMNGTDQNTKAVVSSYLDSLNFFSIAAGLGFDFALGRIPYLRLEFLWNFKLYSVLEETYTNVYQSQIIFGPRIKLALGFKFGGIRTIRLEESEDSDYWNWDKMQ